MDSVKFRDFFYIDALLLESYFTQLPAKARLTFEKDLVRSGLKLEAGWLPKISTERERPVLPGNQHVALALFFEKYFQRNVRCGDLDGLNERFISGAFELAFTKIKYDIGADILLWLPRETFRQRLRCFKKTFMILGDAWNCFHALGRTKISGDESSLAKLYNVIFDMRANKLGGEAKINDSEDDPDQLYPGLGYHRYDTLCGLKGVAVHFQRRTIPVRLKGILKVRNRLKFDGSELVILYPLFLERAEENGV